ncbi:MAG: D-tyrosyl-tRNA(Tyr) deacylase [Syntrophaceae bacterium]|nr:D-tyrosyl-tRNA(Tyr) deacylase [Syntrophaceae bacterium]
MRAVIQRVERASVSISDHLISAIGKGILVLLGVEKGDLQKDADYLIDKIINLRVFEDKYQKMNLSLIDVGGEMLVVSQFTLLADCRKGRRPSFIDAELPDIANHLYKYFIAKSAERIHHVAGGEFQATMKVELVNDGPVTILIDSKNKSGV